MDDERAENRRGSNGACNGCGESGGEEGSLLCDARMAFSSMIDLSMLSVGVRRTGVISRRQRN